MKSLWRARRFRPVRAAFAVSFRVTMMLQGSNTRETRDSAKEVKCLVDPAVAAEVLKWSRSHLSPDPHAGGEFGDEYQTTSLYFDTSGFDVYHRRGSFRRSKY